MKTINCNGFLLKLSRPIVMGILNITPDSFFDGGRYLNTTRALQRAEQIICEGGKIIDIGAYSSRPGAEHISCKEELKRLTPILKAVKKEFPKAIISIDTFRPEVAKIAVNDYQAAMINDISGGGSSEKMFKTIADLNVPYILMHTKGTPKNMQNNPIYDDLLKEVLIFFAKKIQKSKLIGINDIIIDPGFGFGKTIEHNFKLMDELDKFKIFELPILVGISRKSMIYKKLNISPEEALTGTIALNTKALIKGADILRVHDVKEAVQIIDLVVLTK